MIFTILCKYFSVTSVHKETRSISDSRDLALNEEDDEQTHFTTLGGKNR